MTVNDLPVVNRRLKAAFGTARAPVIDLVAAHTRDPFYVLIGTILSARTQDATTAAACRRLFGRVRSPADLRQTPTAEIERLIFPVGFYRTKARMLSRLPDVLDAEFGGRIPETVEELCRLPGVGRKTANLVVALGFGRPAICVDVHVHRISNRFGLVRTRNPHETEKALRRILPIRYWITWNSYLVAFGQTRCRPRFPRCADCPLRRWCEKGRTFQEKAVQPGLSGSPRRR
jgi:endonuclease-3